jgi:hypothetical protein
MEKNLDLTRTQSYASVAKQSYASV